MSSSLRKAVVALAGALLLSAFGGCAQTGTTPNCKSNLTEDGIDNDPEGCETFGQCRVATVDGVEKVCAPSDNCPNGGSYRDANVCCCPSLNYRDGKGEQITFVPQGEVNCLNEKTNQTVTPESSNALKACLYGYGALDIPDPAP